MPQNRQDSFIDRFSDIAIEVSRVSGVAPEVVLGQAALETGWGKSVAGNNMFGVKGKGQSVVTHEDIPGQGLVKRTESFRAYSNPIDSFADYGRLMNTDRYSGIGPNQTVAEQIASIGRSGYATDRRYGAKLAGVIDRIQDSRVFQDRVVNSIAALEPAIPDFSGIPFNDSPYDDFSTHIDPVPSGRVDFGGFLDAPANLAGFSLPDAAPVDFTGVDMGPAPMSMGTFNDVFDAGFPGQNYDGYTGSIPDIEGAIAENERQMGEYNARVANSQALQSFEASPFGVRDQGLEEIDPVGAFGLNGPMNPAQQTASAPQLSTPSMDMQSMVAGDWADKVGVPRGTSASAWSSAGLPENYAPHDYAGMFGGFSVPRTADLPAVSAAPASLPSLGPAVEINDVPTFSAPKTDYGALVDSTYGMGKPQGGFLDAMANPSLASAFGQPQTQAPSIGPFGWGNKGLTIGGFASPIDALSSLFGGGGNEGYQGSGMAGDTYSNARGFRDPGGWSLGNLDKGFADALMSGAAYGRAPGGFSLGSLFGGFGDMFGAGGLFGGSDGYYGGGTNGPGSSRGDGSYAESSGWSDNNPQGIL